MRRLIDLAHLQLEQYETARFLERRGKIDASVLKRIEWTMRLKLTKLLAYFLGVVLANIIIGAGVRVVERVIWLWVQVRIKKLKQGGLKIVAIAGSYGKTSVKHYTYELLRHRVRVVATPESFNTVLGIAKCLKWEVEDKTQIFLVEVGAYHIGDITYLLKMVQPDIGVLTGIARQHLERFGSFENIITAKLEIARYMLAHQGVLIANGSDPVVKENVEKLGVKAIFYTGEGRREINLAGAKAVTQVLGVKADDSVIREPKNRFELTTDRYGMAVIDDSFSSNEVGFHDALNYLGKQTRCTRILVTPGLVELGRASREIHERLGKAIVGKVDLVILVGHNERTEAIARGIGGQVKVIYIEQTLEFMRVVRNLKLKKDPLVLLENDVTENY